ncbi:MAG: C_GCAxxG_C_C family protein [Spirochaetes bacterium]|nr:C_GCAxxG_C_C family protein [Spirochaetota bacterium]
MICFHNQLIELKRKSRYTMKSQEKILPEVQTLWDADNNCAQSTGAGILENLGYKEDAQVLFDSFYCFGGGFKEGSICGVVSGTLAAISYIGITKNASPDSIQELGTAFREEFKKKFGDLDCKTLLSPLNLPENPSSPENSEIMVELGPVWKDHCTKFVNFAPSAALDLIEKKFN